jgi:hypothetical protein
MSAGCAEDRGRNACAGTLDAPGGAGGLAHRPDQWRQRDNDQLRHPVRWCAINLERCKMSSGGQFRRALLQFNLIVFLVEPSLEKHQFGMVVQ